MTALRATTIDSFFSEIFQSFGIDKVPSDSQMLVSTGQLSDPQCYVTDRSFVFFDPLEQRRPTKESIRFVFGENLKRRFRRIRKNLRCLKKTVSIILGLRSTNSSGFGGGKCCCKLPTRPFPVVERPKRGLGRC